MPEVSDPTPSEHDSEIAERSSAIFEKEIRLGNERRAQQGEGAAEGRTSNWGEVVTRQPYRKVRLDHLLSKEEEVKVALLLIC